MYYVAAVSQPELGSLAGLVGESLNIVMPVVWCAELRTAEVLIRIRPEEVMTPDTDHPRGAVDRPMIITEIASAANHRPEARIEPLGIVHDVNIISTLVSFSPTEIFPEQQLVQGVMLPASKGYSLIYQHPSRLEVARALLPEDNALVMLDIAIELVTDHYPSVVLYTRGFVVDANLNGLPDSDWAKIDTYARHSLKTLLSRHAH
jgi:hypothetical protein